MPMQADCRTGSAAGALLLLLLFLIMFKQTVWRTVHVLVITSASHEQLFWLTAAKCKDACAIPTHTPSAASVPDDLAVPAARAS